VIVPSGAWDENAWARIVVQNVVKWRTVAERRACGGGSSDWIGRRADRGWLKRNASEDDCNRCHTRRSPQPIATQHAECSRKRVSHLRSKRSIAVAPSRSIRMAIDGGISRRFVSSANRRAVEDRAVHGQGKGDVSGRTTAIIATLVGVHDACNVMLAQRVAVRDTPTVVYALNQEAKKATRRCYKRDLRTRARTTDNRRFTLATKNRRIFCDPQRPWQRGRREHQWRLRQVLSEGHRLSVHSKPT